MFLPPACSWSRASARRDQCLKKSDNTTTESAGAHQSLRIPPATGFTKEALGGGVCEESTGHTVLWLRSWRAGCRGCSGHERRVCPPSGKNDEELRSHRRDLCWMLDARHGYVRCVLCHAQVQHSLTMGDRNTVSASRQEHPLREWMIFALAVTVDISFSAGFVPSEYSRVLRSLVIFFLYREWTLALACGFLLPRFLPLTGVCFLKQKWLAFKVSDAMWYLEL